MTSGRVKITEQDRRTAIWREIINSRSPLTITPGMWKALDRRRKRRFPWFWRRRR